MNGMKVHPSLWHVVVYFLSFSFSWFSCHFSRAAAVWIGFDGCSGCLTDTSTAAGPLASYREMNTSPGRVRSSACSSRLAVYPAFCAIYSTTPCTAPCRRVMLFRWQQTRWCPEGSMGAWHLGHMRACISTPGETTTLHPSVRCISAWNSFVGSNVLRVAQGVTVVHARVWGRFWHE
jgi:hypothetical protein